MLLHEVLLDHIIVTVCSRGWEELLQAETLAVIVSVVLKIIEHHAFELEN
jgi:hypothetical protein